MEKFKRRVFEIIQIGNKTDPASVCFDLFIVLSIFTNLFVTFYSTYESAAVYEDILGTVELVTIVIFTVEYILRLWTAGYLYPDKPVAVAILQFVFSFYGLVDLLTFLPYYLPVFFPAGAVAFRMLRVFRIFRLFRINSQYDAFNVIVDVLRDKKNQLVSSVCIIIIFLLASSMCMYSVEHEAQPEVFENAFSGIWWATSALLTVGYGDMYPVTTLGKFFAIIITFLGVGIVAIPTGIISAGFVERYARINNSMVVKAASESVIGVLDEKHPWIGREYGDIELATMGGEIRIRREDVGIIIPDQDFVLRKGDEILILNK